MERILIVDDSPVEARIASNLLTGAGYTTTVVRDSGEVAGVAHRWHPDLILLNVVMPKIDGYQICQQLKADPEMRHMAVTLYTIRDEPLDDLKGVEVGADDFLIKTLDREDFLGRVKQILAERRMNVASPLETLNPALTQLLSKVLDRRALIELLFDAFTDHVRTGLTVLWDAYVTGVLVSWATKQAAVRFPFFPSLIQSHALGLPFEAAGSVSTKDLIEAFRIFSGEIYQLATKLTRAHRSRLKEARVIGKVFTEMINQISAKGQELPDRAARTIPATEMVVASPGSPMREPENERLRRALHDLQEQVDILASSVSRDVSQPLRTILRVCQFLNADHTSHLDVRTRMYLQSIEQASQTMKELIEDAVHYAQITSTSGTYEAVNLGPLIEQVRKELSSTLTERGATLRVAGEWPTVTCDRERLKELLTELTTNAIKFNDSSSAVVEIGTVSVVSSPLSVAKVRDEASRTTDHGPRTTDQITFYVKDNGMGIEEAYHESIFRLFYRLPQSKPYKGTGAGLAVCRRIVESHGGRIWVQSQLGAGATFFFTLPREIPSL
jgi:signal transduction histidine kinase